MQNHETSTTMITPEQVERWHASLPAERRGWLKNARGLSDETIGLAKLGWDGTCLTIPIKDASGAYVSVKRRYPPEKDATSGRYKNAPGSKTSLYGVELLRETDTVIIAEGELDSLILRSNGFVSVSSTGGCKTFDPAWAPLFATVTDVYVIYDNDEAGRNGAQKVRKIIPHAKIVSLPSEVGEKGDVTDYFMKLGRSRNDLAELLKTATAPTDANPAVAEPVVVRERIPTFDNIMQTIPLSTPLATLPTRLRPLYEALASQEEVDPVLFIEQDVRRFFNVKNKGDMKPFVEAYNQVKDVHDARMREQLRNADRTVLLETEVTSAQVFEAISKIGLVDPAIFDLVIATYISARLNTDPPIWLMLVGAPSSFKTELVRLIDLPEIYSLDTLTENAFVSGYIKPDGTDPEDLLPLLNGRCFVVKDLTTLFSLKEDTIKKILGDLTAIFDGKYEKFTATRGNVSYNSRFAMIACITPAILSKHHRYMHQLGGRFFFVRVPELTEEAIRRGRIIAWDSSDRGERIKYARQIVSTYASQLSEKALATFSKMEVESPEIQEWINTAADFIARARGTTISKLQSFTDKDGKNVDYYEISDPQIEQPWRLLNQLRSLARVLAAMRGRTVVTTEELRSLRTIALSSMPIDRAVVLDELLKEGQWLTPRETGLLIDKSSKTAGRDLKELFALGLVDVKEVNDAVQGRTAKGYSLKPEYKAFLLDMKTGEVPPEKTAETMEPRDMGVTTEDKSGLDDYEKEELPF